jgi:hypothetical protein
MLESVQDIKSLFVLPNLDNAVRLKGSSYVQIVVNAETVRLYPAVSVVAITPKSC